jgi:hypothetical protein
LNGKLTNNLGFISTSKINFNLLKVKDTEIINSYTYFNIEKLNSAAFNYKDEFELLVAKIQESTEGDYYELYGEYNGKIFEDFIAYLNSQPNSDYIVFHEITVTELINSQFIETAKHVSLQTTNFERPIKFRPIIENAGKAVSYSISYVLRLINKIDNLQILKTSQITSYDTKKYGKSLKRLYLPAVPVINKVYNKLEKVNYNSSALYRDKLITQDIIKPEYINVFNDRTNIVISNSQVSIDNFENTDINTTDVYYNGESILKITPYDNFILFNFYKKAENDLVALNLSVYGDIYLNFKDKEEIKIKEYPKDGLKDNQKIFKISKNDSRKLAIFTNLKFYITQMINDENDIDKSSETLITFGIFEIV